MAAAEITASLFEHRSRLRNQRCAGLLPDAGDLDHRPCTMLYSRIRGEMFCGHTYPPHSQMRFTQLSVWTMIPKHQTNRRTLSSSTFKCCLTEGQEGMNWQRTFALALDTASALCFPAGLVACNPFI